MTDMTLVLRLKADGTAEVIGAAKQVQGAVAGIGEKAREAAAAEARLSRLVDETRSPVERLTAALGELERLKPFAKTTEEAAALERQSERVHAALKAASAAQDGVSRSSRLAAHEVNNLTYQIQDAAVQLAGGQNPFLILMQQGPQALGAVGGVSRAMSLLATPQAAVAAGALGLASAFAMTLARAEEIDKQTRQLDVSLKALNPTLNVTGQGLRALAFDIADATGARRLSVAEMAKSIAETVGVSSADTLRSLTTLAVDMQAVLGGAGDQIGKRLADAFAAGVPGIRKLDDELGFLTAEEVRQIELMGRHGKSAAALDVAMEALGRRFSGAATSMRSEWGEALRVAGNAWDAFMERIGKSEPSQTIARKVGAVAEAFRVRLAPSSDEELQQAREYAEKMERASESLFNIGGKAQAAAARKRVEELERQRAEIERISAASRAAPPVLRQSNDLTPEAESATRQTKWLGDQKIAYDELTRSLKGAAVQRQINKAVIDAEKEASERNLNELQTARLVEIRVGAVKSEMTVAAMDNVRVLDLEAEGTMRLASGYINHKALFYPEVERIYMESIR